MDHEDAGAEPRTQLQIRHHYEVEKELAARLRNSTKVERLHLYSAVYDELYRRVPDHPQLTRKQSLTDLAQAVRLQVRFLKHFLPLRNFSFLELGPGDCSLSIEVAKSAKKVYAVDVSCDITKRSAYPANLELVLSDGTSVPVAADSVDIAYSNQLMEHLHPDDALEQLQNVYKALSPGGMYVCITPNRLNGPHDVSETFDEIATGFHLREYTISELKSIFKVAGFISMRAYVSLKGRSFRLPMAIFEALEQLINLLPKALSKSVARWRVCRALLGIRMIAVKGR